MNGATSSSSTETGAYELNGMTIGGLPALNNAATFYVPTEDQWYKAAYYKGGGTNAGYWNYATQSDTAPTAVTGTPTGIGTSGGESPVTTGNFANWNLPIWNDLNRNVHYTTVGTNGGPSAYGAFDMSGNVLEWSDLMGAAGWYARLRGGSANDLDPTYLSSSSSSVSFPWGKETFIGFRLASPVASGVPEIDPAMGGSALSLVAGVLAMIEQRRRRVTLVA
jgi:formylglycine-generating enzyme required for sulfatase activity